MLGRERSRLKEFFVEERAILGRNTRVI